MSPVETRLSRVTRRFAKRYQKQGRNGSLWTGASLQHVAVRGWRTPPLFFPWPFCGPQKCRERLFLPRGPPPNCPDKAHRPRKLGYTRFKRVGLGGENPSGRT